MLNLVVSLIYIEERLALEYEVIFIAFPEHQLCPSGTYPRLFTTCVNRQRI